MISRLKHSNKLLIAAMFPLHKKSVDDVDPTNKTAIKMDMEKSNIKSTPMDRLYLMFSIDEFGHPSPQMAFTAQVAMLSSVVGACIGGFVSSRVAFINFVETNDASKFKHHYDAKKQLQDKVTISFGKGAFQWGWRLTAFSTSYTLFTQLIAAYRGDNGVVEHVAAGAIAGTLYKVNLGLRGMIVGGILGIALGTMCGVTAFGLLKLTGATMYDIQQNSYRFNARRDSCLEQGMKMYAEEREHPLILEHDRKTEGSDNTLKGIQSEASAVK